MKKLFFLILTFIAFSYCLIAQPGPNDVRADVLTPKGSTVVAWILAEDSWKLRSDYDADYAFFYPNATQIKTYDGLSSTKKFNCHGFAWLRSVEGIDRWIGTGWSAPHDIPDPEMIYMTDGSYEKATGHVYPGKVFWGGYGEDHSAITTSHPDTVISKWKWWPLMKHHKDDNPFGPSSNYLYYVKAPIYPTHCENCIFEPDKGELALDCGGPCPPCQDALNNKTINQNSLQSENYAFENISTSGNVVLNSGGEVFFMSGDHITLNSGFKIESGTTFKAVINKNPAELTRRFRKVCVLIPNAFTPNGDGINDTFEVDVAGVVHISITIVNRSGKEVWRYSKNIYEDGKTYLWNGGDSPTGVYYFELKATSYDGKIELFGKYNDPIHLFR